MELSLSYTWYIRPSPWMYHFIKLDRLVGFWDIAHCQFLLMQLVFIFNAPYGVLMQIRTTPMLIIASWYLLGPSHWWMSWSWIWLPIRIAWTHGTKFDSFQVSGSMIEELYWSSVLDLPFFAMLGLSEVTLSKAIFERLLSERKQTTKFLGKMSHELRTPLVGLRAGWELIQEFLPPGRDATAINHIRLMVEKCFMGILTQIDNILDESKFQSGNLLLHVAQENLHDLLKTAVNMVELKAAAKNVTVALDIHPTVPHRVIVDWQKLTKVILNLLTNAIKYSHDGQRVEVSDYGVGLAQDQIGKIFRAYELGVNRGTSLPYGAGFGLSISRHIVEMMGGWIDVHSAGEEKGAEFLVHLHIKEVPPEAPFVKCPVSPQKFVEPLKIRDPDGVDLHRPILLAEDNLLNQRVIVQLLNKVGFTNVDVAANGQLALDFIAAHPKHYYGVLLLDLEMPVMDGLETLARMALMKTPLPVIILTAHVLQSYEEAAAKFDIKNFIRKPFKADEMINAVACTIRNNSTIPNSSASARSSDVALRKLS